MQSARTERTPRFIDDLKTLRARRSLKWTQGADDPDRICLTVAEMDIAPPAFLLPVLEEALRSGETGYADTTEQERACGEYLARHHAAQLPADAVRCTTDVLAGVRCVLREALPPGSAVILETPVYGDLFPTVREAGCVPVPVALAYDPERRCYLHDWAALHDAAARGGRAWIVSQPHNPIGRMWDRAEVAASLRLAREHDLLLLANEVHLPLGLAGPVPSLFADPAVHEARVVGLTSASKAFNIPGLKSASLYASHPAAAFLRTLPQGVLGRPGILGALATVACYDEGSDWLDALRTQLNECVDTVLTGLSRLPFDVTAARPQATYLIWAETTPADSPRLREALTRSHVRVCPGSDYGGEAYESFFRINAASHPAILTEALQALASAAESSRA